MAINLTGEEIGKHLGKMVQKGKEITQYDIPKPVEVKAED